MNPDVPERERSPVPKRRWKPLSEPDQRTIQQQYMQPVQYVTGPAFEMPGGQSGH